MSVAAASPDARSNDWVVRVSHDVARTTVVLGNPARAGAAQILLAGDIQAPAAISSDPTAIVALIEREGLSALETLRGRFALAILEPSACRVRIVRDLVGSHPLFYTRTPDAFIFASSMALLRRQPGVDPAFNRVAIADHLCKRWPDKHETFFAQIKRLPAGWHATVSSGGLALARYWHPAGDRIDWLPDAEVDRFDALFDQAVARGLARGRAGIFLSGGFDSVSVAAVASDLAQRHGQPAPLALSLGFPDPSCNEQPIQASVARTLDLPFHLQPFADAAGARGLLAEGLDLNQHLSAPLFNSWMPAYLSLVREARADGVTSILTGEGGDEWLGATPFFAADLLARGDLIGLLRMARTWKRSYRDSWGSVIHGTVWNFGLRPLLGAVCARVAPTRWDDGRARRAMGAVPDWVAPNAELRAEQWRRARAALPDPRPAGGFYHRESAVFLDHPLNAWLFEEQHQIGQILGVQYTHPYWDADLVAHVYRVRPERLNDGNRTKALVRQTVDRRFPALGFERQRKVAALDFFVSILRREGPALGERIADFSALGSLGLVAPDGARAFMRAAWTGTSREMGAAWNLINMESWVRAQAA